MDPLSQAVLGAGLAMALAHRDRQRVACLAGAVGGLVPDLDVLIRSAQDPLLALEFHRHFTHSLAMIPFLGAAVGWALGLLTRLRAVRRDLIVFGILGTATHGLLDACTSYGTQLYWPFSNTRVAWHMIAIIDPIPTLTSLVFVVLAYVRRSPRLARVSFVFFVGYLGLCALQRERAAALLKRVIAERGHSGHRLVVLPTIFNNIVFRSLYEHGGQYYIDALRVTWTGREAVRAGTTIPVATPEALVARLPQNSPQVQDVATFSWFADGYLVSLADGSVGDVRYAVSPESNELLWWITLHPESPQRHVSFVVGRTFDALARSRFLNFVLHGSD